MAKEICDCCCLETCSEGLSKKGLSIYPPKIFSLLVLPIYQILHDLENKNFFKNPSLPRANKYFSKLIYHKLNLI